MSTPRCSWSPDAATDGRDARPGGDLVIRHLDSALIAVDKPAGLPSVPGRPAALHDCVARRVAEAWPGALVVHRLDMATSGLMLLARSARWQRALGVAFAQRAVVKRYAAVVHGVVAGSCGTIALPIGADWALRPRRHVALHGGRPAVTHWRVTGRGTTRGAAFTRLDLQPVTGRTHQLRVHLAAIGHPIAGDPLYGPADDDAQRLHLHATYLAFAHPAHGERVTIESTAPF